MQDRESYNLKVYTPAGLVLEERVKSVSVTTEMGEIGILALHTRYTGLLAVGVLSYQNINNETKRMVVSGGFCNFLGEDLVILADSVDLPDSVDRAKYAKDRGELEKIVQSGGSLDPHWVLAKQKLARIEAIEKLIA